MLLDPSWLELQFWFAPCKRPDRRPKRLLRGEVLWTGSALFHQTLDPPLAPLRQSLAPLFLLLQNEGVEQNTQRHTLGWESELRKDDRTRKDNTNVFLELPFASVGMLGSQMTRIVEETSPFASRCQPERVCQIHPHILHAVFLHRETGHLK